MGSHIIRVTFFATILFCVAAQAAQAQVCVSIDESQDTLGPGDRAAAVLLLNRQFALAGEEVSAGCTTPYLLAHIKLGNTITVTLSGPRGEREGTAVGLDDLPALYNQMVRSLLTGRPMEGLAVVDRRNVTAAQAAGQRVYSDAFTYARLGYGAIYGGRAFGTPSFGFGYRAELDTVAIDVSFLNVQVGESPAYYSGSPSAGSSSLIKLSGLYMLNRQANAAPYVGGGLSWGRSTINQSQPIESPRGAPPGATYYYTTNSEGSGLQGELTAGYEIGRATTLRLFVQADATLPFYTVKSETISSRGVVTSTTSRYTPTVMVSVGLGWQRNRK